MEPPPDLAKWRKGQRAVLLARRVAVPAPQRAEWDRLIETRLEAGLPLLGRMVIGFYWPCPGEFDARSLVGKLRAQGARAALPAVVAKKHPLEYREWWPGVPMNPGAMDIMTPEGTPVLLPDAVLMPPVGFSEEGARLGYGAGYFDRTLASLNPQPLKIGVAYELQRMPTIYPQPHDVLMDFVVTEADTYAVDKSGLKSVTPAECSRRADALAASRRLPRSNF